MSENATPNYGQLPPRPIGKKPWTWETIERVVVVFDMVSSSSILADLTSAGKTDAFLDLVKEIADFFWEHVKDISPALETMFKQDPAACCYNFVGDGWLLLFPAKLNGENLDGEKLFCFLNKLSTHFDMRFETIVARRLDHVPANVGLTFGIECGTLLQTKVFFRDEYIGLPLCIASRLQKGVKTRFPEDPTSKVLVSKECSGKYFNTVKKYSPTPGTIDLKIESPGLKEFPVVGYSLDQSEFRHAAWAARVPEAPGPS